MKTGTPEYKALHYCIGKKWGRDSVCEHCPRTEGTRFDWANVSGEYREHDRSDWLRLCRYCHLKLDYKVREGKAFKGHKHSEESKEKIRQGSIKMWQEKRDKILASMRRGVTE